MLDFKPSLFQIDFPASKKKTYISPVFWSFRGRYRILAVHKYAKSDADPSGYKHMGQYSRPDQISKLIKLESLLFNCRHRLTLMNEEDILTVVISTNGKDEYRNIDFNK